MLQPATDSQLILLFAGIAIFLLLSVVSAISWMAMRQSQRSRELEHAERMKAIELGQPLIPPEHDKLHQKYVHNIFWIAFWIGAGVPISAAWAASYAMAQGSIKELSVTLAMWIGVAVSSV